MLDCDEGLDHVVFIGQDVDTSLLTDRAFDNLVSDRQYNQNEDLQLP